MNSEAQASVAAVLPPLPVQAIANTGSSLCGVHGWLKFFVVMNLYVGPVLFGLSQVFGLLGCALIAEEYPALLPVVFIEMIAGIFLTVWGVQVARGLRDIKPKAVQNAKALLCVSLVWVFVDIPICLASGLDADALVPDIIKSVLGGLIGFAVWYSYFTASKRVQATYPDWNDQSASHPDVSSGGASCARSETRSSQSLA